MKFHIIAIESKRPLWAKSAFENYQQRFDQSIQVKWSGIKSKKNSKSLDKGKLINKEGAKLLNSVNENSIIVYFNNIICITTIENATHSPKNKRNNYNTYKYFGYSCF